MNLKNTYVSWLLSLTVFVLSTSVSASPRNQNSQINKSQLDSKVAELLAQKKQTEAMYQRLLDASAKKEKLAQAIKSKPQLVKVSLKSQNKIASRNYNKSLKVTATAYTSHVNQTDSTPNIAAWGDRLKPGMKVIAVSRDLLTVYGLKHKQKVRIKGLKGEYMVLDKMNKRWRKKIDIYMGMNKKKALRWGRRKVEIYWNS